MLATLEPSCPSDAYACPPERTFFRFFSIEDLGIGADLNIYGRMFHVYDCDQFTRAFYESLGGNVGEPEVRAHERVCIFSILLLYIHFICSIAPVLDALLFGLRECLCEKERQRERDREIQRLMFHHPPIFVPYSILTRTCRRCRWTRTQPRHTNPKRSSMAS